MTLACDSGLELSKTLGIYDKLNGAVIEQLTL